MAGRQSPEQGRISVTQRHGEPARCAERRDRRDRRLPVPPRSQAAAGPPGCRQHGCHFVEEKKKERRRSPYRFNGLRGFLRKGGKTTIRRVSTSFPNLYGAQCSSPPRRRNSVLFRCALRRVFHGVCATISTVQHQHGQTAATALKLKRAQGHTYLSCAIIDRSNRDRLWSVYITDSLRQRVLNFRNPLLQTNNTRWN